ncbi:MAG: histidine phosphatase family protein [Xanthomonadales bacterium]|nr:histidine phosphatase family protein [Xanthomonadales bacterium]
MQTLMILRHAKAEPWSPAVEDFTRPLSDVGRDHAAKVAQWIHDCDDPPAEILCSPSQRTRETLSPLLRLRPELETCSHFLPQLYRASPEILSRLLDGIFESVDRVLIVGHNPGLEQLAGAILAPSERARTARLPTGTLLVTGFASDWAEDAGRGILHHRVRGKKLPQ